jgi:phosphatidate cytidylyltransferase
VNWKHFLIRILLVAVAFPVFGALIFLLPQLGHLAFNAAVVAATVVGAFEVEGLFRAKKIRTARWLAPVLAGTLPVAAYLETMGILPQAAHGLWPVAALAILLVRSILFQTNRAPKAHFSRAPKAHFSRAPKAHFLGSLPGLLSFTASSAFVLFYPGFSLAYIVRLSGLPDPSLTILFFLCLVFGNDMSAYFAGSLWGRSTCLHLPVSPRKSAVGFAAGIAGSFLMVFGFRLLAPKFLGLTVGAEVALALVAGIAVILGDLIESGLKRSAGLKDSGVIIPGRGGVLDSVDSMVLAAPLLYGFLRLVGR